MAEMKDGLIAAAFAGVCAWLLKRDYKETESANPVDYVSEKTIKFLKEKESYRRMYERRTYGQLKDLYKHSHNNAEKAALRELLEGLMSTLMKS